MARNGSGVYTLPSGSTIANGDVSDATDLNTPLADLETDANTARPVVAGGTGQTSIASVQGSFKIAPFDGAANISGVWEWQDDVALTFGNDADATVSWVSADSALALKVGGASIIEADASGATITGALETDTFGTTAATQIDARAKLTLATKQATTSGTAFDFTGIPAGTKEINIMFRGVSLSGSDNFLVQIGDSGGIETTGYASSSTDDASPVSSTSGFVIKRNTAATTSEGIMTLRLFDAATFDWAESHGLGTASANAYSGGGGKALSAELTQVRVTRTGTDTFDAGEINISYR